MKNVIFPIVILKKKNSLIYYYQNRKELTKTTREIINSGTFKNCTIIDSSGNEFKILKVNEISYAGWIKGWHPAYKGTYINVNFELSEKNTSELDDFKNQILKRLNVKNHFTTSIIGLDEIKKDVEQSQNHKMIIELFA